MVNWVSFTFIVFYFELPILPPLLLYLSSLNVSKYLSAGTKLHSVLRAPHCTPSQYDYYQWRRIQWRNVFGINANIILRGITIFAGLMECDRWNIYEVKHCSAVVNCETKTERERQRLYQRVHQDS